MPAAMYIFEFSPTLFHKFWIISQIIQFPTTFPYFPTIFQYMQCCDVSNPFYVYVNTGLFFVHLPKKLNYLGKTRRFFFVEKPS